MPAGKAVVGARLRAEREVRGWSRETLARRLRAFSREPLPAVESLAHMVKEWEAGKHGVSARYRALYAAAFRVDENVLFGDEEAVTPPWRAPGADLDGGVTPDDEERLALAVARPSRLDAGTVETLSAILAGQRRLEDAIGPAVLVEPVTALRASIVKLLREASGPYRDELARIVAEWTTFTGWLHAAMRRDARALRFFDEAESIADDVGYGTAAALATSFRGYVARQQGRPRGVIRAASAALATQGVHRSQRTFDTLQAAQGFAAIGERDRVRRLLDAAVDLAADAGEPPPPVYWYTWSFFRLNIGVALAGIGEYRDAVDMLSSGLDGMPADQRAAEWVREYEDALTAAKNHA